MFSKRNIVTIILCVGLIANVCHAQDDKTKSFLYLSFLHDCEVYYESAIYNVAAFDSGYKKFSYECTKPIEIPVSKSDTTMWDGMKYTIQLYKITNCHPNYYIMRFYQCDTYKFSFTSELWIRISGFKECDLKVFFDALRKRGIKKKEIIEMVELWRSSDEMFSEIDWDCLLKGYFKDKTCFDCFISETNSFRTIRYMEDKNNIYAVFSKKPLAGILLKLD